MIFTLVQYYSLYRMNMLDSQLKSKSFQKQLRKDVTDSGIIAIKIAQWMSHRSDLFSLILIKTLKPLVNYVPNTHPLSWTYHVVSENTKNTENKKLFQSISHDVLGSGSISQVHLCKLIGDDTQYVVKVRHKDIEKRFIEEKNYWRTIMSTLDFFRIHRTIDIHGFINSIESQLSYEHEFKNYKYIKKITDEVSFIKLPRLILYPNYPNFLIMTFESGFTYSQLEAEYPEYLVDMSKKLIISYFWMVYKGKIHCDLHDGNSLYVIEEDDKNNKLVILDFGLCFSLDSCGKNGIAFLLWKAFCTQSTNTIHSLLKHILIRDSSHDSHHDSHDFHVKISRIRPFSILSKKSENPDKKVELSFIDWLENILNQLSHARLQMQTSYMYVFMGFIILGRSFSLKNKITGIVETFDVFGSSLQEMKNCKNAEIASVGKELCDDFIRFSLNTNTKEKINSRVAYDV